jgi:rRNA maturation RNase YbeY
MERKSIKTPIHFHYLVSGFSFPNRNNLKKHIVKLFSAERIKLDRIDYIFCADEYLLEINKDFLNHHYYTDIITFYFHKEDKPVKGEIYISIDRVRENAEKFKTGFAAELNRVIFHGALHLCGYSDKSAKEQLAMRRMEDKWLSRV